MEDWNRRISMCLAAAALILVTASEARAQGMVEFPLMGFTPMPFDASADDAEQAAIDDVVYETLSSRGNIIAHHFDEGVPWQAAFEGRTLYHPNIEAAIANRLARTPPDQRIYLALTPLAQDRRSLADNWGAESREPRPGAWAARDFGDFEVLVAYYNFCREMIRRFQPDYFAYAIEANLWADETDPDRFSAFWGFSAWIYQGLKAEFPELPIFLTVVADDDARFARQWPYTATLLGSSDLVAVSSYPYFYPDLAGDPASIPDDWFSRIRDLAPGKPYAVAETGYIAEDLSFPVGPGSVHVVPGDAAWQDQYLQFVMTDAVNASAAFVIWFVSIDYDALWEKISTDPQTPSIFLLWKDTGLIDETFTARPALFTWDVWLAYSRWLNGV